MINKWQNIFIQSFFLTKSCMFWYILRTEWGPRIQIATFNQRFMFLCHFLQIIVLSVVVVIVERGCFRFMWQDEDIFFSFFFLSLAFIFRVVFISRDAHLIIWTKKNYNLIQFHRLFPEFNSVLFKPKRTCLLFVDCNFFR